MGPPARFRSIALAFFVAARAAAAPTNEQSVSTSRQFIVYGMDLATRGVICDLAEATKRQLLGLLGQPDDWITPIVINAQRPQANRPELPRLNVHLGQTGFGLKLQLDLLIDPATNRAELRRELLRALVLEMMYRREPQLASGETYASPPEWLLDGIPSDEPEMSRERVAGLLALMSAPGNVWPLHRFIAQRTELLDAAGRKLYRAYSYALVDLLSHGPDGPRPLARFILDLPHASNDSMQELQNHFPEIFGAESAEITWQRQIARLSSDRGYQLLSAAETERRLDEALRLRISERGRQTTYDLSQFQVFQKQPAAKKRLVGLANNLTVLATRAHPIYAPVIAEYMQIVFSIEHGRTLDVPKRLAELVSKRKAISARMRAIDDYMNWFEATSQVRPSGQFGDYRKAAERAARPSRTKRDSISLYLDALEPEFERERK